MDWLEVTVQTVSAGIEAVAQALTVGGFDSLVVEDQAEFEDFLEDNRAYWDYIDEKLQQQLAGLSRIKLYIEADGRQQQALDRLQGILEDTKQRLGSDVTGELTVQVTTLENVNWETSWQDSYPVQLVGRNLAVLPCWKELSEAQGRIPVILDPGLTFGTGAHASTQMCMEAMEDLVRPGCRVIDLGSGSGILSITALRLGAASAAGVDIDPKAEDIARENAGYNGLDSSRFTACTGNVTGDRKLMEALAREPYDLVLVNIVADVIISLAPVLPRFMGPDAKVICSGILDTRLQEVEAALSRAGLRILERRAKEDWRCLVAGRR